MFLRNTLKIKASEGYIFLRSIRMSVVSASSSLPSVPRSISKRLICKYTCTNAPRRDVSSTSRRFTTSNTNYNSETNKVSQPRWKETPPAMTAPFRLRPPKERFFRVNQDPEVLDQALRRLLGPEGDKLLTDEVKWLSVTHKSFDHGRRGYNARLAFFGRSLYTDVKALFTKDYTV